MYYSAGTYEAFAHPEKPEGVDNKSAYIIGTGLAGLTAAFYLVRDEDKAFIARVFSYAFVGLMLDWIKDDMRADPEALVERFALVIHNDLSSALERFRVG